MYMKILKKAVKSALSLPGRYEAMVRKEEKE